LLPASGLPRTYFRIGPASVRLDQEARSVPPSTSSANWKRRDALPVDPADRPFEFLRRERSG
jgi:hypothetical protein